MRTVIVCRCDCDDKGVRQGLLRELARVFLDLDDEPRFIDDQIQVCHELAIDACVASWVAALKAFAGADERLGTADALTGGVVLPFRTRQQ